MFVMKSIFWERGRRRIATLVSIATGTMLCGCGNGPTIPAQVQAQNVETRPLKVSHVTEKPHSIKVQSASSGPSPFKTEAIRKPPALERIRLSGAIQARTPSVVQVHSRFAGQITELAHFNDHRHLRVGDKVKAGQPLGKIYSKEVAEQKNELVADLARLEILRTNLKNLEEIEQGVVAERTINKARLDFQLAVIAVAHVQRTLRSWGLDHDEIEQIQKEAQELRREGVNAKYDVARDWAQIAILSPIDGTIIARNVNIGDNIVNDDELYRIANLEHVKAHVHVNEDQLVRLRALAPEKKRWSVDLAADPTDIPVQEAFELIGNVLDEANHTALLVGDLENVNDIYAPGRTINAVIEIAADGSEVLVPASAIVEADDGSHSIFVKTAADASGHVFERRPVLLSRRKTPENNWVYLRTRTPHVEFFGSEAVLAIGEEVLVSHLDELASELANLPPVTKTK